MSNQLLDICSLYEVAEYTSEQTQHLIAEITSGLAQAQWHAGTLALVSQMLETMQQVYQDDPEGQLQVNEEAFRRMEAIGTVMDIRHYLAGCARTGLLVPGLALLQRRLEKYRNCD